MKAGWFDTKIEDLCIIGDGNHSSNYPTKDEMVANGVPFIRSTNIINGELTDFDIRFISQEKHAQLKKGHLKTGDVLITNRGEIGKTAIVDNRFDGANLNSQIAWLRCKESIFNRYLFYFLNSNIVQQHFESSKSGAALQQFTIKQLKELKISHPNYSEQQRIVAILDQAFEGVAKARANAELNLQNARALFESHLQSVFTQRGESWVEKTLSEACEIKPPKSEAKKLLNDSDLVSFAPMEDLGIKQKYLLPNKQRPLRDVAGSYTYFAENDVLLAKITPCFENGKLGIAKNLTNGIGFGSSEYIVFRPNKELTNEFLYYFLSRERFFEEGAQRMTGAVGHKRVSKEFIEGYKIAIPCIELQTEIVGKLDALREETQRLEALYQRKIVCLDELKKSLLQQAFAGEL